MGTRRLVRDVNIARTTVTSSGKSNAHDSTWNAMPESRQRGCAGCGRTPVRLACSRRARNATMHLPSECDIAGNTRHTNNRRLRMDASCSGQRGLLKKRQAQMRCTSVGRHVARSEKCQSNRPGHGR